VAVPRARALPAPRATTATARMASFADVVAFYEEHDVAGNVAPALLGDSPRLAYNNADAIVAKPPLETACTHGRLRTRVAYKEGIAKTFGKRGGGAVADCGAYIHAAWDAADDVRRLWLDFRVASGGLGAARLAAMQAERARVLAAMDAEFGGHDPSVGWADAAEETAAAAAPP
jgi:hypothetical protein